MGMFPNSKYYTTDYDLSSFTSHFIGAGFKYSSAMGIGKFKLFKKIDKSFIFREIQLRAGSYHRSDGMNSIQVSLGTNLLH